MTRQDGATTEYVTTYREDLMYQRIALLGAAVLAALSPTYPAAAASVADFYKGKTVTVVVPSGSGGTFHIYGQLAAQFLARHIPGKPTVVVQNRPGAGGAKAASYMANAAPRDGTVIAENAPGSSILPLLRKVKFDPRRHNWLGTLSVRTYTLASWHTSPVKSFADVKKTEFIVGASGVASLNYQFPTFLNAIGGTKFKVISGYKGGGAINLALERGEVHGRFNFYSGWTGAKPHWLKDLQINIIATLGPVRDEVKNVVRVRDTIEGDMNRQMYDMLDVGLQVGQSFYVPEGVPADRVAALRGAFVSMLKDPELHAEAKRRRVPVNSNDYRHIEKVIASAYAMDKSVAKNLANVLGIGKPKKM
jgi:tripartite-type tricarboxylate transporter receptor subunit TctC